MSATVVVAVMCGGFLGCAGFLAGLGLGCWWHERGPGRAWRCQIARELHGDAEFEPDGRARP